MAKNQVGGYSLFNEVEDNEVKIYNRARVMKNMMLDNSDKDRNVSARGGMLVHSYFLSIPGEERQAVYDKLKELLCQKEVE